MKEFKKPDVKASRYRPEVSTILNKEFFDNFKNTHSKYKNMDNKLLRKIIKKFNQLVYQTVIDTRDGVQLPEGLGLIFIGTCESAKGKNVDYAKSKKYGVALSNNNWHTDGKLAKIFYTSFASKYKFSFRECWKFSACRNFKRAVAKTYPENWTMYIQVEPTKKLKRTYTGLVLKERNKREESAKLRSYNEFDL